MTDHRRAVHRFLVVYIVAAALVIAFTVSLVRIDDNVNRNYDRGQTNGRLLCELLRDRHVPDCGTR